MFDGKFADEGSNPVDNTNIYNLEGSNGCLSALQSLTAEVCWISMFVLVRFSIHYNGNHLVVICNTKHSSSFVTVISYCLHIMWVSSCSKALEEDLCPRVNDFRCSSRMKTIIAYSYKSNQCTLKTQNVLYVNWRV